jgi:hypothetical protein
MCDSAATGENLAKTKEYRSIGRGYTQAYGRGKLKR